MVRPILNRFLGKRPKALLETMCAVYLSTLGPGITASRMSGYILKHVMSMWKSMDKSHEAALQIHRTGANMNISAAQVAMLILRNGGSAVDAVEMAIKILEDREITNAGYGSNLAMDGVVECDASIVDHYGRSGAVGAVARKLHK